MLHDDLKKLNRYPFHMPGHKRSSYPDIAGSEIDITEIDGFDDLHDPSSSLKELEEKLAALYSSKRSFLLVNGSTVGILAAVFSMTDEGDTVIAAANCHKSVFNACELRKLKVITAYPDYDCEHGLYKSLGQDEIDRLISNNGDVKLIIVTSPTYEGYISEISSFVPVLIDAAHGAHLPFMSSKKQIHGAITVTSLHKTLPALTQTAAANIYDMRFSERFKHYIDIFETSSPSYVLMNSASVCIKFIEEHKDAFSEYEKRLADFYADTKLNHFKFIKTDDIGKINLSLSDWSISPTLLAERLRNIYGIECETAQLRHLIFMTSVCDGKEAFDLLSSALTAEDKIAEPACRPPLPQPEKHYEIRQFNVDFNNAEKTRFEDCAGKVCAEFVYAYPPGIPILAPNDIIAQRDIDLIKQYLSSGVNIKSGGKLLCGTILTKP